MSATLPRKMHQIGLLEGKSYRIFTTRVTNVLQPHNLTTPEWKLLGQLVDHGTMKLASLADLLSVEAPLVTSLVDGLEKKKLVKRTNDMNDKRAKVLEITPKAQKLLETVEPEMRLLLKDLTNGLKKDDIEVYVRVMEQMIANDKV